MMHDEMSVPNELVTANRKEKKNKKIKVMKRETLIDWKKNWYYE